MNKQALAVAGILIVIPIALLGIWALRGASKRTGFLVLGQHSSRQPAVALAAPNAAGRRNPGSSTTGVATHHVGIDEKGRELTDAMSGELHRRTDRPMIITCQSL